MLTPTLWRVQVARTTLLLDQPFFGVLALQLLLREDPSCQTAWTNGAVMAFNPAFVETLSADELVGLVAHEVMHCACGHPWRRDSRAVLDWNMACDYAINDILIDAGFKLPAGGLIDPQYKGKSAEWIYDRLPQLPQEPPDAGNADSDPGGSGEVRDAPAQDAGAGPTEADWQQLTQQSLHAARAQGKLPASLARDVADVTARRVDWRSLLRKYAQEIVTADYSWSVPNKRYIPLGLYLPSLRSHAIGRIVVAIDTSGSIDQILLAQFASELRSIISEVEPSSVDVVYCDARIHRVDAFARGDVITINAVGGGGTAFEPVFDLAEQDPPALLIYFTDLDGSFPGTPAFPVIWAACARHPRAVPFGDVVPLE